jgi:hypothetical protein
MPANLWKSLTVQIMALGHSLHEAQCIAAVIVIEYLVLYMIMGYRFSDAEQEWFPAVYRAPADTIPVSSAGNCGTVPVVMNRDLSLLPLRLHPE